MELFSEEVCVADERRAGNAASTSIIVEKKWLHINTVSSNSDIMPTPRAKALMENDPMQTVCGGLDLHWLIKPHGARSAVRRNMAVAFNVGGPLLDADQKDSRWSLHVLKLVRPTVGATWALTAKVGIVQSFGPRCVQGILYSLERITGILAVGLHL